MKYSTTFLKLSILTLFIIGTLVSNAQKLTYEPGKEEQLNSITRNSLMDRSLIIFVEDNDNYYVNRSISVSKIKIEKVDKKSGASKWVKELPFEAISVLSNKLFYCGMFKSSDGFVAFVNENEKEGSYVKCYRMDNDFNLVAKPEVVLKSTNTRTVTNINGTFTSIPYKYHVTKCDRGFLITGMYRGWINDVIFPIAMVSENGILEWQKNITTSEEGSYQFLNAHVDATGNLFMVSQLRMDSRFMMQEKTIRELGGKTKARKFFIHQFDPSGKIEKSESLSMAPMFDSYSKLSCTFDTVADRLNITGQYENGIDENGIFNFNYALHPLTMKNGNAIPTKRKLFSDLASGKEYLKFKDRYDTQDSGYTLVFEEHDSIPLNYTEPDFLFDSKDNHKVNCILLVHISSTGQLVWSKVIRKMAEGKYSEYLSTYTFMDNNKLYLLLNANKESIDKCEKNNGFYKSECDDNKINVLKVIAVDEQGTIVDSESIMPDPKTKYLCNLAGTKILPNAKLELSFDLIDKKGIIHTRKTGYLSLPNSTK